MFSPTRPNGPTGYNKLLKTLSTPANINPLTGLIIKNKPAVI